ncbi:hypothetical protein [uncultured Oscillibacter sp.]|uniref:hypothetical protein n=1 Tax=uncultured Oscillibacter sp. TaxID=876091 RepID=UPI0025EB0B87|nr:hypothetical protein [uncultured Oscillibacter sp.]
MDSKILMEMSDIQMELAGCIGLIAVIADGLSAVSRECCLSGEGGQRYANALYITYDALSGMSGKLREQLDCARERPA